ncbi:hypothetical protein [Gordonia aichiensis]|uniref:Uncharacterized protein n=1 Tax=Gordonia aichiensis NBRC 108223 TaxID=1220583 RepID=L7KLN3_9ACTN|nr:hypothetical protein [Gordonia aichiensis]GAC48867.1 hypothetical protein GOACH_07_01530 [Gordonia aichiensis NBRC 108223]
MGSSAGRVACGGALGSGAAGVVDTLDGLADFATELDAAELDAAELDAATAELSPEAALSSVPQAAIRPAQASPSIAADTR